MAHVQLPHACLTPVGAHFIESALEADTLSSLGPQIYS